VQPLQARLHALLDTLRSRLDAEHARNVQARQDLIARAAQLATAEDLRAAIEEARSLQSAWKTVGPVPRHQDEALWVEFRRHCDDVFERSSQQRATHEAVLGQQHARAVALCELVEQLGDGADAAADPRRLAELRHEFESLELPRTSARDVRRRFARAYERGEESVRRGTTRAVRDGWSRAIEASERVRACLLAVGDALADDEREELRAAADSAIATLEEPWLRAGRELLARTLEAATSGAAAPASVDFAAGEDALRSICVRAELLAGLATPPEDLERRREHQMRRLVESMGQGVQADPGDVAKLALEWLAVGPVEPSVQQRLRARFERCIEALA
jgi:exonuclease SbcC